jgi:hypothetical protein
MEADDKLGLKNHEEDATIGHDDEPRCDVPDLGKIVAQLEARGRTK